MKKIILCFLLYFITIYSTVFAFGNYDPKLLADMYKNPSNYIALGGIGTGSSTYLVKNSINVLKYEPPHYVIAFRRVNCYNHPNKNGNWVNDAEDMGIECYRYNIDEKKMYCENVNYIKNKGEHWEYVNPQKLGTSGDRATFAGGEIAFYLAYNMCFYNEPKSYFLQEFLKNDKWIDFGKE